MLVVITHNATGIDVVRILDTDSSGVAAVSDYRAGSAITHDAADIDVNVRLTGANYADGSVILTAAYIGSSATAYDTSNV